MYQDPRPESTPRQDTLAVGGWEEDGADQSDRPERTGLHAETGIGKCVGTKVILVPSDKAGLILEALKHNPHSGECAAGIPLPDDNGPVGMPTGHAPLDSNTKQV